MLLETLHQTITETGVARVKLSAQETLKLGDIQLQSLRKLAEETKHLMNESCTRFERISQASIKQMNEESKHFKLEELQQYIEKNYDSIKKTSSFYMGKVTSLLRGVQWKNFALALILSVVVGIMMGLYIDDEWPWELHSTVVKQRAAGEALVKAWPYLNESDQAYLENKIEDEKKNN